MSDKKYEFWFGSIRYFGHIVSENDTHWIVEDIKEGIIHIPKASTTKKEVISK